MHAVLQKWYAAHVSIRRMWALNDALALVVFVALEPTPDGEDTLPVWFAHQSQWRSDLESLTGREVRLQLIRSGAFGEPDVDADAVTIGWRDSWESPPTAPP
jgi:hypothetical protein